MTPDHPHPLTLNVAEQVVTNASGQTESFAVTTDGSLDYAWQDPATGLWIWKIGVGGASAGLTGSPAAAAWPGGQIAVYAQNGNGQPAFLTQTGPGGDAPFGNWTTITGVAGGTMLGSPAAWLNTSGAPAVAVLEANLRLAVTNSVTGTWTPWTELLGGF